MFHELGRQQQQQQDGADGDNGGKQSQLDGGGGSAYQLSTGAAEPSASGTRHHRLSELPLLQRPDVAETYVRLLCRFAPRGVLPFLSSGAPNPPSSSSTPASAAVAAGTGGGGGGVGPTAVMPEGYDVRRCIAFCREAGVVDAEAYLHERLGELGEAGRLYLAEVQRYVRCISPKDKGTRQVGGVYKLKYGTGEAADCWSVTVQSIGVKIEIILYLI